MKYEKMIDHTYLKPEGTEKEIDKLIQEAKEFGFGAICINSSWIKHAKEKLKNTDIKIVSVVGFPLGACISQVKVQETKLAIDHGADEIDMVINIGRFKDGQYDYVLNEIKKIKAECGNKVLKVIKMCEIVTESGADFIKTSTGFSYRGAEPKDIEIFNKVIGNKNLSIKAAGGIKSMDDIEKYVAMGVKRFGTSSSVAIFTNKKVDNKSY